MRSPGPGLCFLIFQISCVAPRDATRHYGDFLIFQISCVAPRDATRHYGDFQIFSFSRFLDFLIFQIFDLKII